MSTKKVEQYKKEKYNRKKTIAKQKRHKIYGILVCVAIVVVIAGFAGKGIYDKYFYYDSVEKVDMEKLMSNLQSITDAGQDAQTAQDGQEADDKSTDDTTKDKDSKDKDSKDNSSKSDDSSSDKDATNK